MHYSLLDLICHRNRAFRSNVFALRLKPPSLPLLANCNRASEDYLFHFRTLENFLLACKYIHFRRKVLFPTPGKTKPPNPRGGDLRCLSRRQHPRGRAVGKERSEFRGWPRGATGVPLKPGQQLPCSDGLLPLSGDCEQRRCEQLPAGNTWLVLELTTAFTVFRRLAFPLAQSPAQH